MGDWEGGEMESIYTSPRNLVGIGQLPGEVGRERERKLQIDTLLQGR